jgi:hypothetical protein
MASILYKHPDRKGKHYNKRSLILTEHARQYAHRKGKSIAYQNAVFYKHGGEHCFIATFGALDATMQEFNAQYGDTLTFRHAVLILLTKHYCTAQSVADFHPSQLLDYYPNLRVLLGAFTDTTRSFQTLFTDLSHFHFVNPLGHRYAPTTRVKLFCTLFDKHCKRLFS